MPHAPSLTNLEFEDVEFEGVTPMVRCIHCKDTKPRPPHGSRVPKRDLDRKKKHLKACAAYQKHLLDEGNEPPSPPKKRGVRDGKIPWSKTDLTTVRDMALTRAVLDAGDPFNKFEKPSWIEAFRTFDRSYTPPNAKRIGGELLTEYYIEVTDNVNNNVRCEEYLDFTADESDTTSNHRVCNVCCNTSAGCAFYVKTFDLKATNADAVNLLPLIVAEIKEHCGGNLMKWNSFCTDTCTTMRTIHRFIEEDGITKQYGGISHVFCVFCDSHSLQLYVGDVADAKVNKKVSSSAVPQ